MSRRLLAVLLLLPALSLADLYTFEPLRLGKGYAGPVVIDVTWASGLPRDMTGATGTLTVYAGTTASGVVLFRKTITPAGSPLNRATVTVTAAETSRPGSYAAELTISEGGVVDALHGVAIVEGSR